MTLVVSTGRKCPCYRLSNSNGTPRARGGSLSILGTQCLLPAASNVVEASCVHLLLASLSAEYGTATSNDAFETGERLEVDGIKNRMEFAGEKYGRRPIQNL